MTPDLISWTRGEWHWEILVGVLLGLCSYAAWARWARRRHGETVSLTRIACLVAGFLLVVLALNGPLHLLADRYLFSAHMVQHLLLTLVVPPLLLTSLPAWMADGLIAPLLRRRPIGALARAA